MNLEHMAAASTSNREGPSDVHLSGSFRLLARGGWFVLVILTLAIFFASLPVYLTLLQTPCAGTACEYQQLTPGQIETLRGMGVSLDAYVGYTVALTLAVLVVCLAVSAVIVWRRPSDRMAFLVALLLVTLGPVVETTAVPQRPSAWQVPNECLMVLFLALFLLVFSLFPTGQFVPRWTGFLFVAFVVVQVPLTFLQPGPLIPNAPGSNSGWLVSLGEMATLAFVQLYRYRRKSSLRERQQTKWVVFGFAVPITFTVSMSVPYLVFPLLVSPGSLYPLMYNQVSIGLSLSIALSFGVAMLRSRLWDIDVLINRTLVYGALTLILTAVYFGLIIGLSALLRGLVSQDNSVAIILSTLAIYALFQPLRRHIQRLIDRRFYRRKYDAAKIVAAFNATLRQEVDLDQLREQLLVVVQETMQPSHVSLWIRPVKRQAAGEGTRGEVLSGEEERVGAERLP